jgi:hypothetical protein
MDPLQKNSLPLQIPSYIHAGSYPSPDGSIQKKTPPEESTVPEKPSGGNAATDRVTLSGKNNPQQTTEIERLKQIDQKVRAHEAAHQAAGGQYTGSASYQYTIGPDGKAYAVGGEVSIDASAERDPQATIRKMEVVRAAAMAPADPSSQDYAVAAQATQEEQTAKQQLAKEQASGADLGQKPAPGISIVI